MARPQKVRRRAAGESGRPFFCSECGERVAMVALRCWHCRAWFSGGWRDDTGDRGREKGAA